ncbi:MAG: TetR/AcrR family transcriptional regulator [Geminicoccaceae bacterium]|nr:TetR/AcrR family transcriptional regulator [Geminicoccaceae bacterium]
MAEASGGGAGDRALDLDRVLDVALGLAEEFGWDQLRLSDVAEAAEVPLPLLAAHFPDTNAIADAWFARALAAVWSTPPELLADRDPKVRLERVMWRWFEALAPHRRLTGVMLRAKMWPSHPHHWVPMIFSLSRLVHAFLDVARVPGRGAERALQEIGGTIVTLETLAVWLRDDSPGQARARDVLHRSLAAGAAVLGRLGPTLRRFG